MVARGFHYDVFDTICSSYTCHSNFFLLGLMFAYYMITFPSHIQASMKCKPQDQHCRIHPDGVHALSCSSKHTTPNRQTCVWKPGNHTAKKTYKLILRQESKQYCKTYNDITGLEKMFFIYKDNNMTVEVMENSEAADCTKAVFRNSPWKLLKCDPPTKVTISRLSDRLDVNVSWKQEDMKAIRSYSVKYKALGSPLWSKPAVQSLNVESCTVEHLDPSLIYVVQIQCVENEQCSMCPWSDAYTVPLELTTQPVIIKLTEKEAADREGSYLLFLTWKFSAEDQQHGYHVDIGKTSGEFSERIHVTRPEISLILSRSAYHINISAFNNVSVSPAVSQVIPRREVLHSEEAVNLNVTVHSNTSFTIYWKDDLIKTYVCYSVEWREKGKEAAYMSFYQKKMNCRRLSSLPAPLEPYKRYNITLHTRPDTVTCNMKSINNSESTYGSTQFYFIEGSPVSAPNISSHKVTTDSAELQWSNIPEEDIRGFLLGYTIHYSEYHHRHSERNITVGPEVNSCKLVNLNRTTVYQFQISGFTVAGAGVRSTVKFFTTKQEDYLSLSSIITIIAIVAAVLIFGSPIIKRVKMTLWPSIPDPGNSNTMQKINGPCELELLQSINLLKVEEEWDTNSLHVVEKEAVVPKSTLPSTLPLLCDSADGEESPEMTRGGWSQRTSNDTQTGDAMSYVTSDTFSDAQQTNVQRFPAQVTTQQCPSEYTTMEMFQQAMPQGAPEHTSDTQVMGTESGDIDLTVVHSGLDYIRQFSTSPVFDGEEIVTTF